MIYPTKNNDDANSMYNISDYTLVTGSPLPTLVKANEHFTGGAKESASGDADWNKEYRFVGNYQTEVAVAASEQGNSSEEAVARDMKNVTVPQYSYIYAKKKNTSNAQFWFYTGTEMLWGANKCVVQATARDGGKSDLIPISVVMVLLEQRNCLSLERMMRSLVLKMQKSLQVTKMTLRQFTT